MRDKLKEFGWDFVEWMMRIVNKASTCVTGAVILAFAGLIHGFKLTHIGSREWLGYLWVFWTLSSFWVWRAEKENVRSAEKAAREKRDTRGEVIATQSREISKLKSEIASLKDTKEAEQQSEIREIAKRDEVRGIQTELENYIARLESRALKINQMSPDEYCATCNHGKDMTSDQLLSEICNYLAKKISTVAVSEFQDKSNMSRETKFSVFPTSANAPAWQYVQQLLRHHIRKLRGIRTNLESYRPHRPSEPTTRTLASHRFGPA